MALDNIRHSPEKVLSVWRLGLVCSAIFNFSYRVLILLCCVWILTLPNFLLSSFCFMVGVDGSQDLEVFCGLCLAVATVSVGLAGTVLWLSEIQRNKSLLFFNETLPSVYNESTLIKWKPLYDLCPSMKVIKLEKSLLRQTPKPSVRGKSKI